MIVDFHTHIFPDALAPRALAQLTENFREHQPEYDSAAPYTDATASGLTESADKAGIGLCVVMPVATSVRSSQTINQFAAQTDRMPGLRSFGSVHPKNPHVAEELELVRALGLRGIKLHPEYQDCYADQPEVIEVVRRASDLGLWVLFHAGEDVGMPPPVHGTPARFARLRDAAPDARVILAHMGAFRLWEEAEQLYDDLGFYLDTSFSVAQHPEEQERFARLIRMLGWDHVLFGSDSPWADQETSLRETRDFLQRHQFTQEETAAILGGNALRVLGKE